MAGTGSLIPADKSFIQQRHVYDGQCKAAGLSHMHGLRHQYAQARYEVLTGWKAPVAGGPQSKAPTSLQQKCIEDRHFSEPGQYILRKDAVDLGQCGLAAAF